jgi:hypothetical protein
VLKKTKIACSLCGCHNLSYMMKCVSCGKLYCFCRENGGKDSCHAVHGRSFQNHKLEGINLSKISIVDSIIDSGAALVDSCPSVRTLIWRKKFKCPLNWMLKSSWLYMPAPVPSWMSNGE